MGLSLAGHRLKVGVNEKGRFKCWVCFNKPVAISTGFGVRMTVKINK
jgi:hypothetical protein